MARLIRANSETPNVANNDDFRLFRYATGGYNGVVENYGNECSYTVTGSDFKINSGIIVYQGVDTEILTAGDTITVDNISGTQYYVVYLEIDLSDSANQTAIIKSSYDVSDYPVISAGDDLTTVPSGVANFELYRFTASSGVISNVVARFEIVEVGNVLHAENADLATLATTATMATNSTTQDITDNSTKVATTAYVNNLYNGKEDYFITMIPDEITTSGTTLEDVKIIVTFKKIDNTVFCRIKGQVYSIGTFIADAIPAISTAFFFQIPTQFKPKSNIYFLQSGDVTFTTSPYAQVLASGYTSAGNYWIITGDADESFVGGLEDENGFTIRLYANRNSSSADYILLPFDFSFSYQLDPVLTLTQSITTNVGTPSSSDKIEISLDNGENWQICSLSSFLSTTSPRRFATPVDGINQIKFRYIGASAVCIYYIIKIGTTSGGTDILDIPLSTVAGTYDSSNIELTESTTIYIDISMNNS